jgi:hypothetical protein
VCSPSSGPGRPPAALSSAAEALAAVEAGLGYLAGAEVTDWPAEALAGCLRALGRAEGAHVAAQSRVGRTCCRRSCGTRPTRSCSQPRPAAATRPTWPCWPSRCTSGPPRPTPMATTARTRTRTGSADAGRSWASARAAGDGTPGWVYSRAAAEGYACDAQIIPVVTGRLDPSVLDAMTDRYLAGFRRPDCQCGGCTGPPRPGGPAGPGSGRLQNTLLAYAADILSGPAGLAAFLRDRHCSFPGCRQKPVNRHAHHLVPRAEGGVTALPNLVLLCQFHHLIAVHRWGWTLALNADGTTTATSPDRSKVLHSHGPPQEQAA